MFNMYNVNDSENAEYYKYYTIQKGDNLYQIAKKYNVNPNLLAALNGLNINDYIYPDQIIMIPKAGYSYYITKEGDTLNLVSNTFSVDCQELIRYNPTIYLREGQLMVGKSK